MKIPKIFPVALLALVFASQVSRAAGPDPKELQKDGAKPAKEETAAAQKGKGNAEEVRMEEVEIRGELENPDVFYIIPRRKADMDTGSLSKDYSKDIMKPIMREPFEAEFKTGVKNAPSLKK